VSQAELEETHNYIGKVGSRTAYFTLTWKTDKSVVGSYICPEGKAINYDLSGDNLIDGILRLIEFTDGIQTAQLNLRKKINGNIVSWAGIMRNIDGRELNVSFKRHRGAIPTINENHIDNGPNIELENMINLEVERRIEQERIAASNRQRADKNTGNSIEAVVKKTLEQQIGSTARNLVLVRKSLTEHEGFYVDILGQQRRIRVVHDLGAEILGGNLIITHQQGTSNSACIDQFTVNKTSKQHKKLKKNTNENYFVHQTDHHAYHWHSQRLRSECRHDDRIIPSTTFGTRSSQQQRSTAEGCSSNHSTRSRQCS
jgi:hypothetical protein